MPERPDPRDSSRPADARPPQPDASADPMLAGSRRALADAYRLLAERYADLGAVPAATRPAARQDGLNRTVLQPSPRVAPHGVGEGAGNPMGATWSTEDGELHLTGWDFGGRGATCAKVEGLGEVGWDWHVWDPANQGRPRYGMADTLDEAKRKAEGAMHELARELGAALAA